MVWADDIMIMTGMKEKRERQKKERVERTCMPVEENRRKRMKEIKVKAWGVRGSVPRAGSAFMNYGCNTSCWSVELEDRVVIFDAGSGIINLGDQLLREACGKRLDLFLGHLHYDHVIGLLGFPQMFREGTELHIYGECQQGVSSFRENLEALWSVPFWPVALSGCTARLQVHDLEPQATVGLGSASVTTIRGKHPGNSLLYRLKVSGKKMIYGLDCQMDDAMMKRYAEFASGADLVLYDANFTSEDLKLCRDWGHSSWEEGLALKKASGIQRMVMTHFSANYTDDILKLQEELARAADPDCLFAREGMEITL